MSLEIFIVVWLGIVSSSFSIEFDIFGVNLHPLNLTVLMDSRIHVDDVILLMCSISSGSFTFNRGSINTAYTSLARDTVVCEYKHR